MPDERKMSDEDVKAEVSQLATLLLKLTNPALLQQPTNVVIDAVLQFTASVLVTAARNSEIRDRVVLQYGIEYIKSCVDHGYQTVDVGNLASRSTTQH